MKAEYRNIVSSLGSSFKARFFEDEKFPAAWHCHPQYELTYMLSSTGTRYVGDSMNSFGHGDLVLVGANLPHCWKSNENQNESVQCVIIQWDEGLFGNWSEKPELTRIRSLLKRSSRGIKFNSVNARELENKFLNLVSEEPFNRLISLLSILQELATTDEYELLAGAGFTHSLSTVESERINTIYNYIKENFLGPITLKGAADQVSMSRESFCRFFKKTLNKTFFEFLNEYKVNLACKMLIDTDLSVSEIAYNTGYNNPTFFHRQFNKFMTMSPSQYRKEYRRILN